MQDEIRAFFKGDISDDEATLAAYSHDASLFEVRPKLVVFPKNADDVAQLVAWVSENKERHPDLSITARSAGTCMSGGSVNESIIMDFSRYMNKIGAVSAEEASVEPGAYYRDFEKATLEKGSIMPAYTASREICAVGGMVGNNAGGEKSIKYGKTENYVRSLDVVLRDGKMYTFRPLSKTELDAKIAEGTFEGNVYKELFALIDANYGTIKAAKPAVSKNSAGYYLWNVWDRETGIFDLTKLFVGSQGTLGLTTNITFGLVPVKKYQSMVVVFMPTIDRVGDLANALLAHSPESVESYDDYSLKLAVKFFADFIKQLGIFRALLLGIRFIPEALMMLFGRVPKLIVLAEFTGDSEEEVVAKAREAEGAVARFGFKTRIAKNKKQTEKYWKIRRESFNMLRKHVQGKRTAPFIDDIIVKPEYLSEFLPKVEKLLDESGLVYTVAGHVGNGNFHIIPLMDLSKPFSADMILDLSDKVYALVKEYGGSITAEHNDGIIRTPYLETMYGKDIVGLFEKVKKIFDPENIFNPGKKVGGSKEYIREHLIREEK